MPPNPGKIMTAAELLAEYGDHVFDEIDLEIEADSLAGFATACGAADPDPVTPDPCAFKGDPVIPDLGSGIPDP